MEKLIEKSPKRFLAILIATVLIAGMIPVSSILNVFAATEPVFTVEIDNAIRGDISVTVTNPMNPSETKTESATAGTATFSNFVDSDIPYDIKITGMIGYDDYEDFGQSLSGTNISFSVADFVSLAIGTIEVTGQITDENGNPYTGGGTVSYSGYDEGSVNLAGNGTFSVTIYENKPYSFSLTPNNPKYNSPVSLGSVNSPVDFTITNPNTQLSIQTFSITTSNIGANGLISPNVTGINYNDSRTITATAAPGFVIASFTDNGDPVPAAIGQDSYPYDLTNIRTNHIIVVAFAPKECKVTFTYNSDGIVTDDSDPLTPIPSGGRIIANEGDSPSFTATANTNYHISSVVIDSTTQTDGTFDNAQTDYSYTYTNINKDYSVTVTFSINTYDISISPSAGGSVTPAGSPKIVSHGGSLELTVTPINNYTVDSIKVDGVTVDLETDSNVTDNDDYSLAYTFSNVDGNHMFEVSFAQIVNSTDPDDELFDFNKGDAIASYKENGKDVYVYSYNAAVTFVPVNPPFNKIRLNGEGGKLNNKSLSYTSTKEITKVEVKHNKGKPILKQLGTPILIVIDKTPPTVDSISKTPSTTWTNQGVTVSGTASDTGGSKLYQVRYSKNASDFAADTYSGSTASVASLTNGSFSFSVNNDVSSNDTYYVWAYDLSGNKSAAYQSIAVNIDIVDPDITDFTFRKIEPPVVSQIINFLTFGTFYNDEIEVIVSAKDDGISSGLKEITLYSNGAVVETKPVLSSSATFTLTLADFNNNEISASVTDNAGNNSADNGLAKPTDIGVTSNANSDNVILKTEEPTISIEPLSTPVYTNDEEGNWYSGDVGFTVSVSTESAGLYSVIIKVNNVEIINDTDFSDALILQRTYTVNTSDNHLDGENKIEVIVVNNCGVEKPDSKTVFVDSTNPKVIGFIIDKENDDALSQILNFLTFGTSFNEKAKITVIADDRYGATSGINTITLYADGEPINGSPKTVTAIGDGTYKAEFVLPESVFPESKLFDSVLTAVATDNVHNITGKNGANPNGVSVTPTSVNSDLKSDKVMIETVNPVIDISSLEAVYIDGSNKRWYPDDVLFTVTAKDTDAGIRSVQIKINDVDVLTDVDGKAVNANFFNAETHEAVFKINTSQGTRADDGSYLIEVTVTDNAGNVYSVSDIVYKDIDKPIVTGYRFVPATSDRISETSAFIDNLEYGFYFQTEFTAIIEVSDGETSSGLGKVEYRFVSYQDGEKTGETSGTQSIVEGMAVLTIPQGFRGQIFVAAFDSVENLSDEETPQAFVIDNTNPEISITNNDSTDHIDADGNKLYVSDMSFTVVVSDYRSGIKEIGYSQSSENGSYDREVISVNNTGYSAGDDLGDGWTVSEMDANLVTKATKTFTFSCDDNDITLTFDATDRSGNTEESVQNETITVDKTNPIINIVFRDDNDDNVHYDQNRIADITVIERNFDSTLILAAIENTFGSVPTFSFTKVSNAKHTAVIDFGEGDYTFDVTGTDLGAHVATVNFRGGNENLFFVDKTKPAIEENFIEFEKSNPSFGNQNNSFNIDKTVKIKVTEHNFDPELVNLLVTRKDAGEAHNTSGLVDSTYEVGSARWESLGDVHTISFTLERDAVYQVSITPADLAGNIANPRNTVVFEIDKTVPIVSAKNGAWVKEDDIKFLDVYPFSRKDDPVPTVEFYDLNIDHIEYNLTVCIPDNTSPDAITVIRPQTVYLSEDIDNTGKIEGSKFTLPDFVQDGVYALELVAVDVAGNKSLLNLNTYARMIEQDVLAYILESNVSAKTGLYSFQYENGDTISKRPDNFSDIRIFVLTKKDTGIDIVLRDNNAYEVDTYSEPTTDDSLYGVGLYNFVLESSFFKDNFQDDTDVEMHLTVKNEGSRIDLGKMHIDNVAPTCTLPGDFQSWSWYYGEENRTITVSNISELIDENQCTVYDNGKELNFEYLSADNTLSFTLGKGWHNIGIIIDDMAGNANNIQEKANIHIGFFWLWVIIASSVALIGAAAFITFRCIGKKRRLEID